jgi:hypothetical protein
METAYWTAWRFKKICLANELHITIKIISRDKTQIRSRRISKEITSSIKSLNESKI